MPLIIQCLNTKQWYMRMKSQHFSMAAVKNRIKPAVFFWHHQQQIYLVLIHKFIDGFGEMIACFNHKFGFQLCKHFGQQYVVAKQFWLKGDTNANW